MSLLPSLRRSSSSLARLRCSRCPIHQGVRSYSSSAAEDTTSDRNIGHFLKLVAGVVATGSAAGMWFLSSSFTTSTEFPEFARFVPGSVRLEGADEEGLQEKKPRYLFGDAYRRRVFFNYEKRIRMRSPPEKVFGYFASYHTPEGDDFMTPADLMRAVVPVFPPSDSNKVREGYLRGERRPGDLYCSPSPFFLLFDMNNDGLISFPEYIFFVTLLSIPESSFSVAFKMFDIDNNGKIKREEFKKVMTLMRSYNRQGACHRDGLRIGHRIGKSVENGGLVEYFFGKDGTNSLEHDRFVEFLRELHHEIVRLEFTHYDYKSSGSISAKDFALSMVASADIKHINKFLDRVDELDSYPHLRDVRISLEEFKSFAELRRQLRPLALAIFSYGKVNGLLTKSDFQRATDHVCGVSLSNNVVDVIFHVFDSNQDGSLSADEFVSALQRREANIRQPVSTGVTGIMSCLLNCAKNCSLAELLP